MNQELLKEFGFAYVGIAAILYTYFVFLESTKPFARLQKILNISPVYYNKKDFGGLSYYLFFLMICLSFGVWLPMLIYISIKEEFADQN